MDRIFWQNDSSGVANRPDFLSTIATKVKIYRQEIFQLSADSITLHPRSDSGSEGKPLAIPIDVLIYCTGWSATTTLFPHDQASTLGLSVPLSATDPQTQKHWQTLEKAARPTHPLALSPPPPPPRLPEDCTHNDPFPPLQSHRPSPRRTRGPLYRLSRQDGRGEQLPHL